jgi:small subunit ribosomal protein S20
MYVIIRKVMANTHSAKKAIRNALKKKAHNNMWEKKVKDLVKDLKKSLDAKNEASAVSAKFLGLQKAVDKAAKEKVIHKNKANRLKSRYAIRMAALQKDKDSGTRKSAKSAK